MKGGKIATPESDRGGERVQNGGGTIKFTVDVMRQVFSHLADTTLDFRLLKRRHAIEAVDRKHQERRCKNKSKEGQKCANPLRWHP